MSIIDCRSFEFKKWIIPKTKPFTKVDADSLTIGYFDFVKVEDLNSIPVSSDITLDDCSKTANSNPLQKFVSYKIDKENRYITKAFSDESSKNNRAYNDQRLDITNQQLFAFTNVSEHEDIAHAVYSQRKLNDFWKKDSLIRFYSLLHIYDGSDKSSVFKIIDKINHTFSEVRSNDDDAYNAICYFSLDYSDIIICTKNTSIKEFTDSIFSLNFNTNKKIIRDSFSLISIDESIVDSINELEFSDLVNYSDSENAIREIIKNKYNDDSILYDRFSISFNIGVQNYNTLEDFLENLHSRKIPYLSYIMLGRHDVAICREDADIIWLLVILCFIDKFTQLTEKYNDNTILFNCESYIRIPKNNKWSFDDHPVSKSNNQQYLNAKRLMDEWIKKYLFQVNKIQKESNNIIIVKSIYVTPIITLRNSILGLLKNGFAEDFVLCIFKSFLYFLEYIYEKISMDYQHDKNYSFLFNDYFDNVNSLINSAMHSDRQFIQSPSFNPVFYDIPPKLMAYYTAMTEKIFSIIKTNDHEDTSFYYSFMFRPSFDNNIKVVRYSYDEIAPANRLLAVTINESDLYYPHSVLSQICHEVAHYVGGTNRMRETRKHCIVQCYLYDVFYSFLKSYQDSEIDDNVMCLWINSIMGTLKDQSFYTANTKYADDLENLLYKVLSYLKSDPKVYELCKSVFMAEGKTSATKTIQLMDNFMDYLSIRRLQIMQFYRFNQSPYNIDSVYSLKSIFSETYADLQMLMILNLSIDDYFQIINRVFRNNPDLLYSDIVKYRVLNIIILFTFSGHWKIDYDNAKNDYIKNCYRDVRSYFDYINNDSFSIADFLRNNYGNTNPEKTILELNMIEPSEWLQFHYWNINIQHYLYSVFLRCQKNYFADSKKCKLIAEIKDNIKTVQSFEDAVEVFCKIQDTNERYANKIYTMSVDDI